MNNIQAQITRLRTGESRLINELNQARQELQQIRNQWENTDRPRLLNMLFSSENQDSVRNGTLTQILDKFQNEVLNPGNQGGSNQGSGSNTRLGEQHEVSPEKEMIYPLGEQHEVSPEKEMIYPIPIPINYERMERQNNILEKDPKELINRPLSEIIKDFRTLIGDE